MSDHLAKEPRTPDSLLISLKELRRIENDRVDTERQTQELIEHEQRVAAEQAEQAERQTRKEAEQRQRRREEQARSRKEAEEREATLRLAEAERRARVEAEMRLERERLKLELASASPRKRQSGPWGIVSVFLVVLLSGGLVIAGYELHQRADVERESERRKASLERVQDHRSRSEQALLLAQARLRDQGHQIKLLQTRVTYLRSRAAAGQQPRPRPHGKKTKRPRKPPKPIIKVDECNPDDPICGIPEPTTTK